LEQQRDDVLSKECLCIGLSNAAAISYEVPFLKKLTAVTICPGPNIVNFSKVASLCDMTDHIYGRKDIMQQPYRPSMFVAELKLYIDFLKKEIKRTVRPTARELKNWENFCDNLLAGIDHYLKSMPNYALLNCIQFETDLRRAQDEISHLHKVDLDAFVSECI